MMKINLSGEQDNKKNSQTTVAQSPGEAAPLSQPPPVEEEKPEIIVKERKKVPTPLLIVLLIVLVAAGGYLKRDFIMSLIPKKSPVVEPVAPPPPPPPKKEVVEKEPDPTFVVLNRIAEAVPPRLWLTSAVIKSDGTYQIKGFSFSYQPMTDMVSALEGKGTVAAKNIPAMSKSSETVYQFGIDGNIAGIKTPEILDNVPTDDLVAAANTVKGSEKEFGVKFSRLPKSGQTYTDKDVPFTLEGSYEGLKKVISVLCPEGGKTRVFNLMITPSAPGGSFDRVKASFSLKQVSAI
ncbi:PilN domain-containing protein [bacterium]|nr:PilN domain-containing protein [bacterium]